MGPDQYPFEPFTLEGDYSRQWQKLLIYCSENLMQTRGLPQCERDVTEEELIEIWALKYRLACCTMVTNGISSWSIPY